MYVSVFSGHLEVLLTYCLLKYFALFTNTLMIRITPNSYLQRKMKMAQRRRKRKQKEIKKKVGFEVFY